MTALPNYIDPELWSLFVESRKEGKHPLTQAGQKIAIRKLMRLHNDGWDANASLEDSIYKSYRGLFPVAKQPQEPSKSVPVFPVSDEHISRSTKPSEDFFQSLRRKALDKTA